MGLFDDAKKFIEEAQKKLPDDMNSPEEIKAKAKELAQQHGDQVTKYGDIAKDKIPGQADDKIIDAIEKHVDKFKQ